MSTVQFASMTPEGVTIQFDDKIRSVGADHPNFNRIKDKLLLMETEGLEDLIDLGQAIRRFSSGVLEVHGHQVYYAGEPLPDEVASQWLLSALQNGEDLTPLVNYIDQLMQNPDYHNVHGALSEWLQANQYQLMEDGRIVAPKGVTEDYKDCHSRTIDYSPGQVVEMPRWKVEKNPNKHCSPGLHVGNWNYAGGWGRICMMMAFSPRDVVSVPAERDCPKLRVCKYESLYRAHDLEHERQKVELSPIYRPDYGPGIYTFEVVGLTNDGDFYSTEMTIHTQNCREVAEEEAIEEVAGLTPFTVDDETLRIRQLIRFETYSGDEYEVTFAALNDFGDRIVATKHVFADSEDEAVDIARSELTEADFDMYTDPDDAKVICVE